MKKGNLSIRLLLVSGLVGATPLLAAQLSPQTEQLVNQVAQEDSRKIAREGSWDKVLLKYKELQGKASTNPAAYKIELQRFVDGLNNKTKLKNVNRTSLPVINILAVEQAISQIGMDIPEFVDQWRDLKSVSRWATPTYRDSKSILEKLYTLDSAINIFKVLDNNYAQQIETIYQKILRQLPEENVVDTLTDGNWLEAIEAFIDLRELVNQGQYSSEILNKEIIPGLNAKGKTVFTRKVAPWIDIRKMEKTLRDKPVDSFTGEKIIFTLKDCVRAYKNQNEIRQLVRTTIQDASLPKILKISLLRGHLERLELVQEVLKGLYVETPEKQPDTKKAYDELKALKILLQNNNQQIRAAITQLEESPDPITPTIDPIGELQPQQLELSLFSEDDLAQFAAAQTPMQALSAYYQVPQDRKDFQAEVKRYFNTRALNRINIDQTIAGLRHSTSIRDDKKLSVFVSDNTLEKIDTRIQEVLNAPASTTSQSFVNWLVGFKPTFTEKTGIKQSQLMLLQRKLTTVRDQIESVDKVHAQEINQRIEGLKGAIESIFPSAKAAPRTEQQPQVILSQDDSNFLDEIKTPIQALMAYYSDRFANKQEALKKYLQNKTTKPQFDVENIVQTLNTQLVRVGLSLNVQTFVKDSLNNIDQQTLEALTSQNSQEITKLIDELTLISSAIGEIDLSYVGRINIRVNTLKAALVDIQSGKAPVIPPNLQPKLEPTPGASANQASVDLVALANKDWKEVFESYDNMSDEEKAAFKDVLLTKRTNNPFDIEKVEEIVKNFLILIHGDVYQGKYLTALVNREYLRTLYQKSIPIIINKMQTEPARAIALKDLLDTLERIQPDNEDVKRLRRIIDYINKDFYKTVESLRVELAQPASVADSSVTAQQLNKLTQGDWKEALLAYSQVEQNPKNPIEEIKQGLKGEAPKSQYQRTAEPKIDIDLVKETFEEMKSGKSFYVWLLDYKTIEGTRSKINAALYTDYTEENYKTQINKLKALEELLSSLDPEYQKQVKEFREDIEADLTLKSQPGMSLSENERISLASFTTPISSLIEYYSDTYKNKRETLFRYFKNRSSKPLNLKAIESQLKANLATARINKDVESFVKDDLNIDKIKSSTSQLILSTNTEDINNLISSLTTISSITKDIDSDYAGLIDMKIIQLRSRLSVIRSTPQPVQPQSASAVVADSGISAVQLQALTQGTWQEALRAYADVKSLDNQALTAQVTEGLIGRSEGSPYQRTMKPRIVAKLFENTIKVMSPKEKTLSISEWLNKYGTIEQTKNTINEAFKQDNSEANKKAQIDRLNALSVFLGNIDQDYQRQVDVFIEELSSPTTPVSIPQLEPVVPAQPAQPATPDPVVQDPAPVVTTQDPAQPEPTQPAPDAPAPASQDPITEPQADATSPLTIIPTSGTIESDISTGTTLQALQAYVNLSEREGIQDNANLKIALKGDNNGIFSFTYNGKKYYRDLQDGTIQPIDIDSIQKKLSKVKIDSLRTFFTKYVDSNQFQNNKTERDALVADVKSNQQKIKDEYKKLEALRNLFIDFERLDIGNTATDSELYSQNTTLTKVYNEEMTRYKNLANKKAREQGVTQPGWLTPGNLI